MSSVTRAPTARAPGSKRGVRPCDRPRGELWPPDRRNSLPPSPERLMQYLAVFGRQRSGHDAPPRGVRERGSARRTEYLRIPPMRPPTRPAAPRSSAYDRPYDQAGDKLGQVGPVSESDKAAQAARPPALGGRGREGGCRPCGCHNETNKPLAPFENGGIGGALRRQGRQEGAARVPVMICTLATSTSLALVQAPTLAP